MDLESRMPNIPQIIKEFTDSLRDYYSRLAIGMERVIQTKRQDVERVTLPLTALSPKRIIRDNRRVIEERGHSLSLAMESKIKMNSEILWGLAARLDALSPLMTLKRGYSITMNMEGNIIRRWDEVRTGEQVRISLSKGNLKCTVEVRGETGARPGVQE